MWAIIGAALQFLVLFFKEITESKAEKKAERKKLREEFSHAIKSRDYALATILWDRANRL